MDNDNINVSGAALSVPVSDGVQDAVYKIAGRPLMLRFLPPLKKLYEKAPVYFLITGGGWSGGSKESMLGFSAKSAEALRNEGWAVAAPDYRLTGTDNVKIFDIVCDCMDAARWVSKYADILHIDKNNFLTSGHSAGGQLCLMLAYAPHGFFSDGSPYDIVADDFTVTATAPLSAPTVCHDKTSEKYVTLFSYEGIIGSDKRGIEVSPYYYITPASPPSFYAYGTHDKLVLPNNSRICIEKLRSFGIPVTDIASERGGHCFEPMVEGADSSPGFADVQDALIQFAREITDHAARA